MVSLGFVQALGDITYLDSASSEKVEPYIGKSKKEAIINVMLPL